MKGMNNDGKSLFGFYRIRQLPQPLVDSACFSKEQLLQLLKIPVQVGKRVNTFMYILPNIKSIIGQLHQTGSWIQYLQYFLFRIIIEQGAEKQHCKITF